jgi:hypothetical protein
MSSLGRGPVRTADSTKMTAPITATTAITTLM